MLYLVEGLNCSGKSTFIENHKRESDIHFITDFANPLRFGSFESGLSPSEINAYLLGIYKTIFDMLRYVNANDIYWDRTFISAYAYKSITIEMYMKFIELFKNMPNHIIQIYYIKTNLGICMNRWKDKMKDKTYVPIKTGSDWISDDINLKASIGVAIASCIGCVEIKGE